MKITSIITLLTFIVFFGSVQKLKAQSNPRNVIVAKASYGGYAGLSLNVAYERLLADKHRISLYGESNGRFQIGAGIGYKYQFMKYKNFELLGGIEAGYARSDYTLNGGRIYNHMTFAPTIELRYNINNRFQLLLEAQQDFYYYDKKITDNSNINFRLGVGYKF